jgi:hypothetical protein
MAAALLLPIETKKESAMQTSCVKNSSVGQDGNRWNCSRQIVPRTAPVARASNRVQDAEAAISLVLLVGVVLVLVFQALA